MTETDKTLESVIKKLEGIDPLKWVHKSERDKDSSGYTNTYTTSIGGVEATISCKNSDHWNYHSEDAEICYVGDPRQLDVEYLCRDYCLKVRSKKDGIELASFEGSSECGRAWTPSPKRRDPEWDYSPAEKKADVVALAKFYEKLVKKREQRKQAELKKFLSDSK